MQQKSWTSGLLLFCDWVTRCFYINLLWILFTLLGLIIFGFAPATVALFSVARRLVSGEQDVHLFKYFKATFKESFFRANLLGFILYAIGWLLFVDLRYFHSFHTLYTSMLGLLLIYILLLLYIFPVFVSFKMTTFQYIKYALIISISSPFRTLALLVGSILLLYLCLRYQGLFYLFGAGALSLFLMRGTHESIRKIEQLNHFEVKP